MAFSAIISLLAAFLRAFPAIRKIVECALDAAEAANVAEAIDRKQKKDAVVDAAVDNRGDDCKGD